MDASPTHRAEAAIEGVLQRVEEAKESGDAEDLAAIRTEGRKRVRLEGSNFERIQSCLSVGPDGVYIVTNMGLYKFRFNDEEKRIELDPAWEATYVEGDLIYDNDLQVKPGHLNNGSGTTPTLVGDDFVAIVDNAPHQVNRLVFRQDNGKLVSRLARVPMAGRCSTTSGGRFPCASACQEV